MARGLKFRIQEEEGLYYLCSENKGADQFCGHCEADLHLCFRICKKPVFSRRGSNDVNLGECSCCSEPANFAKAILFPLYIDAAQVIM